MDRFNLVGIAFYRDRACRITGGVSFRTLGLQLHHVHSFVEIEGDQIRVFARFGIFKKEERFCSHDVVVVEIRHKFWLLYQVSVELKSGLVLRLIVNGQSMASRIAETISAMSPSSHQLHHESGPGQ